MGSREGICSVEFVNFSLVLIQETWRRTGNFWTTQTAPNLAASQRITAAVRKKCDVMWVRVCVFGCVVGWNVFCEVLPAWSETAYRRQAPRRLSAGLLQKCLRNKYVRLRLTALNGISIWHWNGLLGWVCTYVRPQRSGPTAAWLELGVTNLCIVGR
jgi:hypothetical protein